MIKIYEGAKQAAEYAEPYLEQARDMANGAVILAKKGIKFGQKKIKRKMFIAKLKSAVEITANIVLVVAAIVAAVSTVLTFINKCNDN